MRKEIAGLAAGAIFLGSACAGGGEFVATEDSRNKIAADSSNEEPAQTAEDILRGQNQQALQGVIESHAQRPKIELSSGVTYTDLGTIANTDQLIAIDVAATALPEGEYLAALAHDTDNLRLTVWGYSLDSDVNADTIKQVAGAFAKEYYKFLERGFMAEMSDLNAYDTISGDGDYATVTMIEDFEGSAILEIKVLNFFQNLNPEDIDEHARILELS